jgi:hypothetical protein
MALRGQLVEAVDRGLVADGDVELTLREDEVRDLVVAVSGEALLLQVVARVDVVEVGRVQQQIADGDGL